MADPATKTIEFEGQQHIFPSDFTDTEIQKALKSHLGATSSGIVMPESMIDEQEQSNGIIGGAARQLGDTIKGLYHTVVDAPSTPTESAIESSQLGHGGVVAERIGKGVYEGEKEAAKQTKEQFRTAGDTKGDLAVKGLNYARAGVTAASMADPFATGSVTNINKLEDEGRNREAIGSGGFDALTLLIGGRTGREPGVGTTVNKLAYATGIDSVQSLKHILPDLEETITKTGKPKTVGQLSNVVQDTLNRLDQKFNTALSGMKGNVDMTPIVDALESKARTLPPTAEAQEIAGKLKQMANEYRGRAWTAQELNSERMYRNANAQSFYNKSGLGQMAALRVNADAMIDKTVADESREVLYDAMEKQFPGQGFRELKQKQSSLLKVSDKLNDHIEKLETAQAKRSGAPLSEKAGISASAHPSGAGITPRVHITELLKRGPLSHADTAVKKAFGPTKAAAVRRAGILAMPVSTIMQHDTMDELKGKIDRGEPLPPLQNYKDALSREQMGELMRLAMQSKTKGSVQ